MNISKKIFSMISAPVDVINNYRLKIENSGCDVINLGQAIPDFSPPGEALEKISEKLLISDNDKYTPDAGLYNLRLLYSNRLNTEFQSSISAEELIITAGANHAFIIVIQTIFNNSDNIGLFSPYFLNHSMAIQGNNYNCIEILPDENFNYDIENVEYLIRKFKLKGLVLVNPSNPSGKLYSKEELEEILIVAQRNNIWLIVDEVYGSFYYDNSKKVSIASYFDTYDKIVIIKSFSKEYGISGWRVGALIVNKKYFQHFLKVQDYSIICASRISQELVLEIIKNNYDYFSQFKEEFKERKNLVFDILDSSNMFNVYSGEGAYFNWFSLKSKNINSKEEIFKLMDNGVCIIPGYLFGEKWSNWFRISFGNQKAETIKIALDRMVEYFKTEYLENI